MEEELDEIEEGKRDWRDALGEFYERFTSDLTNAETHMTDIKRMEKPTDLICDKCGKPLVMKWGKHGSFLACTGYPDFSPRNADADIEGLQKDIAKRQERERKDSGERLAKSRARYEADLARLAAQGGGSDRKRKINLRYQKDLESLLKRMTERKQADREAVAQRLEKLKARYPQIEQFYDGLELKDSSEGIVFAPTKNSSLCTYTRELTVDLPDIDGANLSEQGEEEYCQNCGRPMVLKKGRFGTFYACTGYPDCKTTKQIGGTQKKADVILDEKCPQCASPMVQKYGRFGEFTACSNYPACKFVKQNTIGVKCPNCSEGEVVERRSKRGKTFFGCNRYPECDFVAWARPVAETCPECGSPYLTEKYLKAGAFLECPATGCKYRREMLPAEQEKEAVAV